MPTTTILKVVLGFSIIAAVLSSPSADAKPGTLCEDLRRLQRAGELALYALEDRETNSSSLEYQGWTYIPNVDIDGDDLTDEVLLSCGHVGSLKRPDPCTSKITLFRLPKGSGMKGPSDFIGKTFEFEAYGFYFFRHRAKLFVVASADETQTKSNIYRVDGNGFTLVCEKLF